jgi:crossover junction endodeoxyribonuclease RusA
VLRQTTAQKYDFFVVGSPAVQGSKNAIPRIIPGPNGKPRAIASIVEQDKTLPQWRRAVAHMGGLMRPGSWEKEGLFTVSVIFFINRPKSHYHPGTSALRPEAPVFHDKKKDCDKMFRAVGDALTGICYNDDSQIVSIAGFKLYATQEHQAGAWISVARLDYHRASSATRLLIG